VTEVAQQWLFLACLALLMAVVAIGTVRTGRLLRVWVPPRNLLLSWPEALSRVLLVILCLALGIGLGPGAAGLGLSIEDLPADLALGFLAGLALSGLIALAGQLVIRRWGQDVYDPRLVRAIMPADRREWIGVLLVFLPAALGEELLFRALPLAGLTWLIAPQLLLWPISLFFGLLHWPQGGWGVTGASLAALLLGALFLITGSIWAPLAAHYTMNVVQLALAARSGLRPFERKTASIGFYSLLVTYYANE
jgi:membrane protease YdiL (CAAX protease family)